MKRVIDAITSNHSFLITSHVRLDGDALGSELALYHLLTGMGKKVLVYNEDKTPVNYRFLPGSDAIVHALDSVTPFDAVFVLDCSEMSRVGEAASKIAAIKQIIAIDHHLSAKEDFGISLVDPGASSAGELLFRLMEEMEAPVSREMAVNLYTAILTDTGSFRYSNTGADTFRIAGKLVNSGADPYGIAEQVYENNPKEKIELLMKVLETLEFFWEGKISTLWVSRDMLRDVGAPAEYTENFVDFARSVKGVEVAAFLTEMEENVYKASLRSKGRINVAQVAGKFGGGGHFSAAACKLRGSLPEAKSLIIEAIMAG